MVFITQTDLDGNSCGAFTLHTGNGRRTGEIQIIEL